MPLFETFAHWPNAFQVVSDGYATSEGGTGIVHQAPTYGEDDCRVCLKYGNVDKLKLPDLLDENGNFVVEMPLCAWVVREGS